MKKTINLEDIEFNKKFSVYSKDELEAVMLVTPDIMNKLKFLNKKLSHTKIIICGNKMYITAYKNLFTLNFKKTVNESMFDYLYDDISVILGIVTEIKNNNKVFKM